MSKVLLLTAVLLLSLTWVVAQDSSAAGQSNQASMSSSGSETSIEGCLNGSAGNFTLISSTGTYQLVGATDDLSKHVNQQVRVRGTQSGPAPSSTTSPTSSTSAPTPSSSSAASQPTFNVSKVSKIADTCSTSNK